MKLMDAVTILDRGGRVRRLGWSDKALYVERAAKLPGDGPGYPIRFLAHFANGSALEWAPQPGDDKHLDWVEVARLTETA